MEGSEKAAEPYRGKPANGDAMLLAVLLVFVAAVRGTVLGTMKEFAQASHN